MSPDAFRELAAALPDVVEGAHMGHADFRAGGRIFATLGSPGPEWAMVKLPPDQQAMLMDAEPGLFVPASGAWGAGGATLVKLDGLDAATAASALHMAWESARRLRALRPPRKPPAAPRRSRR